MELPDGRLPLFWKPWYRIFNEISRKRNNLRLRSSLFKGDPIADFCMAQAKHTPSHVYAKELTPKRNLPPYKRPWDQFEEDFFIGQVPVEEAQQLLLVAQVLSPIVQVFAVPL